MRILITVWAWSSHYLPLVPMVWALRAAGHDVRVASQPALADVVTSSGAVFVPAGADVDHVALRRQTMQELDFSQVPLAPPPGESADWWSAAERARVARVFATFAKRAELMLDDTRALAEDWQPDLMIFEPTSYVGPIVAARLGVPAVRHIHGVDMTYQAREVVGALVAPLATRAGVGGADGFDLDLLGTLTIDPCPPAMQIPTETDTRTVRYVPYNGPAQLPRWLVEPPRRPRICVTWGATATSMGGVFVPPRVLAALADADVDVIAALSPADRAQLGTVPDNAVLAEQLALHLLLPSCALVVHQGGFGTTLTAVEAGVPQLVLPQFPDQIFGAERVAATGAGAVLRAGETTVETLARECAALVAGPAAAATATLREQMHAQPSPADVVDDLETLAAKGTGT